MEMDSNTVTCHASDSGVEDQSEDRRQHDASKEFRAYRLVAMCFGVLCVLQVALNVYLRIHYIEDNTQHNVTDDERQLRTNYSILQKEIELLKAINSNLNKERDQLLAEKGNYCPEGWMTFGLSCYYKSSVKNTWVGARRDCILKRADLIIINTQEEQDFVRQLNTRAWIGLTDKETEGLWKWVDGTLLTGGFWNAGEPNNANDGENCAEADGYLSNSKWNDVPCHFQWYWICERPYS